MLSMGGTLGYLTVRSGKAPEMPRIVSTLLCLGLLLGGCAKLSQSRFNPLNWFAPSAPVVATTADGTPQPLVPASTGVVVETRVLIDQIIDMQIDPTGSGAILRATGLAATQGFYNAELVLAAADNGAVTYDFRVAAPAGFEAIGTEASRRITVALELSAAELAGIRSVTVRGAQNARESRR
jgi:hypothetical protein